MKVIGWIDYDEIEDGFDESFGGFGGFFQKGMRWADYVDYWDDEDLVYAQALRRAIVERSIKSTGSDHQTGSELVPVFDDGTYASFTFRAWGDLLAAIWSDEEGRDYNYMDFYC